MKLLIAALALLSFVATSALPETVMAQAATGQTQTAPGQPGTGTQDTTPAKPAIVNRIVGSGSHPGDPCQAITVAKKVTPQPRRAAISQV